MSNVTGSVCELLYANTAAATIASWTSETTLNNAANGMGVQAHLPPDFWLPNQTQPGRGIRVVARGTLGETGTPSFTWTVRAGAAGSTSAAIMLGCASVAIGAALTIWEFQGDFILNSIAGAGANSTGRGTGTLVFFSATSTISGVPLWGGAASPGTVATLDTSIQNFINFNVTCSANSASNTITLHQLLVYGLN